MKSKRTITEIVDKLSNIKSALIFSHVRPDGDTIGSAMALAYALEKTGVKVGLCCASAIPAKFGFVGAPDQYSLAVSEIYEAHIAVDCSTEGMIGDLAPLYFSCKNTFNIDHHVSNTFYAENNYVAEKAANCENVFQVISALYQRKNLNFDSRLANLILMGIVTDSGAFAHQNVTSETLETASKLKTYGADLHEIVYKLFKEQTIERARLFATAVSGMKFYHEGKLALITVRTADLEKTGATSDMTEGIIDFPLSVEGVEVAVSVMETGEKRFKISFRSKGEVNVNEIASRFGGGGHILASGCMLNGFFEDVIDKLVFIVGNYL